jgi:hypothetical protein
VSNADQRDLHRRNEHLTFRANMGAGRHGWLRLTPAYGVRLVRERIGDLSGRAVVTDPFSGTGTTPLAAAELGHFGQSVDVNPFLIWLGTVKTSHYPPDIRDALSTVALDVSVQAKSLLPEYDLWQPSLHNIERWWSAGNLRALCAIRTAIDSVATEPEHRNLLDIALCRTLIARSNAAFNHQSMSFKDSPATPPLFSIDESGETLSAFAKEAASLGESASYDLLGNGKIVQGDSREKMADLEPCDLLITSPPYVNRMSYIRELRPYMYWLRFLDIASDAGDLDWKAIGGTWGTATSKLHAWKPETVTPIEDAMEPVCAKIRADGGKNGPLLATYVHKYFHDMWLHFRSAADHVKPGGKASYIVGNSTFYGHTVPAEQWYAAMMKEAGFETVTVTTIRKRNSNRALFEYDVSGTKPA